MNEVVLGRLNRQEADLAIDLFRNRILEGPDSKYPPTQRSK